MAKTVVDIVPKYNSLSQFTKITDRDLFQMNNKVSTLLNFLSFNEGLNGIFPSMGAYKQLQTIPFSENVNDIVNAISSNIRQHLQMETNMTWEPDPKDESMAILKITVEDLPGYLSFNLKRQGTFVKLINPKYVN